MARAVLDLIRRFTLATILEVSKVSPKNQAVLWDG
ncbi:hypothetical protein AmaxDRAFT_0177 [Limnospira maxima CS-328]|uniref:Uncharacterized protein n=1 Tax=Limnospira maxima CS-328 TaxID=513049 RepID=B5VUD3_LIMMA|nr:hypothetical protein AmaxDRAFT_0177 [Limnospira maxima CS-328]